MPTRIEQIIELERDADHLEQQAQDLPEFRKLNASADFKRWRAAQLVAEELDAGTQGKDLARRIGKSPTHVTFMGNMWQIYHGKSARPPFWETYHSAEVRQFRRASRQEQVKAAVQEHVDRTGEVPSSRGVAHDLGLKDDRSTRAAWDRLHEEGELPPRPGPEHAQPKRVRTGGPVGQLVDDINERLKILVGRISSATDKEREWGRDYWVARLSETSGLVEQALEAATGADLDRFLSEVENERP